MNASRRMITYISLGKLNKTPRKISYNKRALPYRIMPNALPIRDWKTALNIMTPRPHNDDMPILTHARYTMAAACMGPNQM